MKYFFDNCISPKIVNSLKVIVEYQGVEIVHLKDKFNRDISDPEWILELSREDGWIIISADPRITRGRSERAAWKSSGMTAFFFRDGFANGTIYDQASELFKRWPEIIRLSRECPKGTGFLIPKKNDIERLN